MKKINIIFSFLVLVAIAISCSVPDGISQDLTLDTFTVPTDVASIFDISNDNTGNVNIIPSASGAGTYDVYFGDTTANPTNVQFGSAISHKYREGDYTVKVVAIGLNGVVAEKTYPLSIVYRAPEKLAVTFTKHTHNLKVKASALYAASYLVFFGDSGFGEVETPLATAAEVSHNYAAAGTYNVKVIALSGGIAQSEKTTPVVINDAFELPITFDNPKVIYSFVTSNGITFRQIGNPFVLDSNPSPTVGEFFKSAGSAGNSSWTSLLDSPIDFSTGTKVKVWVYNPKASNIGKKLSLELQLAGVSAADGVALLKVAFTTSGVWEELVFDYSAITTIPATAKFNQLVFKFNDVSNGRGETFYIDNIRLTN